MSHDPITEDDAMDAVALLDAMPYFKTESEVSRKFIAKTLMRIVNTPDGSRLRNNAGILIQDPPIVRLKSFIERFIILFPGGWPGPAEMVAIYGMKYPLGDGTKTASPRTEGFTWGDNEDGAHTPIGLPPVAPNWKSLPAPLGEFQSEEERKAEAGKFIAALASTLTGNEEKDQ